MLLDHPVMTFVFALACVMSTFAWTIKAWSIIPRTTDLPWWARLCGSIGFQATAVAKLIVAYYVLFRPAQAIADLGGSWSLVMSATVAAIGMCVYTAAMFARAPLDAQLRFVEADQVILHRFELVTGAAGSGSADHDGTP